jgi:hypothetical protein
MVPGLPRCDVFPSCLLLTLRRYLIDDHLKAKCGAPLMVDLLDDTGAFVQEGLPQGARLEVRPPLEACSFPMPRD